MRISDWSSDVCSSDLNHTHDLLTHTLPPYIDPRLTEPVVRIRAMPRAKPRSMARLVACAPLAPRPTTNPPAAAMADANWFARAGPPPPSEAARLGICRKKKKPSASKANALIAPMPNQSYTEMNIG